VQPSQGVHLVFDRDFLPGNSAIMVPHTDDGRVLFVIPWHGKVLVGTTDTPMDKPDLEPRALDDEIGFILRNANRYLSRDPSRADVRSIFAGQRPLVRPPRADGATTKKISRNHEVLVSDGGLVTIVGGKWTTYRKMAEDTLNHAAQLGGLDDRKCVTETLALQDAGESGPSEPLHADFRETEADILRAVREEMARNVEDALARRSRMLFLDAQAAIDCAPRVAELMAGELGRDKAWIDRQVADFRTLGSGYLMK
jgi:glycerol-3-phosphate dehydrogenase